MFDWNKKTISYKTSYKKVGNIRLSNSAESVQYPARRPSTRRILLGANIPRQYPLRSSLRRHKEKQKGTSSVSNNNNNNASSSSSSTSRPKSTGSTASTVATATGVAASGGGLITQGGFLSNSNSEGLSTTSNECCSMESSITFKAPRL